MARNHEKQEDEIELLRSMYVTDFTDLRKDNVWKKKSAPELKIKFRPQLSIEEECNMEVTLYINCPLQYPDKIPCIRLEKPVDITTQELTKLKTDLDEQMKSLVGEVMILELALTVQTFLNDNIRPAPKSFYDEMLSNKQKQKEKFALEQERRNQMIKQKEEKERKIIEEEIAKRCQTFKESTKRKKDDAKNDDLARRGSLKESHPPFNLPPTTKNDKKRPMSPESDKSDFRNKGPSPNSDVLESESIIFGMAEDSRNPDDDNILCYKPFDGTSGHSRLSDDFEHIMSLGKGAFGDVLKVRNKLDGRFYAIKRIPLNPNSQHFTKKITREVKLLSRLNHENVVRYYNSWIEMSDKPSGSETSSSLDDFMYPSSSTASKSKGVNPAPKQLPVAPINENSLGLVDNIECLAPPIVAGKSMDLDYSTHPIAASESDSDDENSGLLGTIFPFDDGEDDDDEVIFDDDDDDDDQVKIQRYQTSSKDLLKKSEMKENKMAVTNDDVKQIQYLFIQMEYCEKSTLRNCIDAGLYNEMDRVWRLFREIIEGLNHLHDQGIIHRDLKPVNIFLDSNDHVKIGDFGLATTDILVKKSIEAAKQPGSLFDSGLNYSFRSNSMGDTELTGNVGTALYVSPEVMATGGKLHYNQKVDSYSLGIIFFEMCYKPLKTGMERIAILNELRFPGIKFPPDFQEVELEQQTKIIKWLLNHDPNARPTTKELLRSDLLPPLQMEEATMNDLFRSTVSNPQSRSYHRLVDALFSQPFSVVQDRMYDSDSCKPFISPKLHLIQKSVFDTIEKVFQYHGAIKFSTPLLMPKCQLYESNEQYACFVDHSGGLVGLPCDQRVPFARFIARSNTQSMKRYCLDKVYQEKKFFGLHPKDMTECAFDIVTPSHASLIPESELLSVISQVIHEFPTLRERNYYFRLNHTSLVRAVLFFCGIREEKHLSVQLCLRDLQHKKTMRRQSLETRCGVTFTDHSAVNFFTLLDFEGSYSKISNLLRPVVKSKGQASTLAKQGLHELETIINYAESLDVKLEVKVTIGLIYNPTQYDGFIFQVLFEHRKKKRLVGDVLAAGGRYEKLIKKFKVEKDEDCSIPSAVGVSLAFEKIVSAVIDTTEVPSSHDIVVCSVGHKTMLKERLRVVKELWAAGLRADVFYDSVQNLEDVHMYCRNYDITYIVCLKDGDGGSVRIRWMEKDKNMEKKVFMVEMVEFLQQKLSVSKLETNEVAMSRNNVNNQTGNHLESHQSTNINGAGFNFIFIYQDMKLPANTRRKLETQIFGKVTSLYPWLPGKSLDVIAFNLDSTVLKTLACYLEINEDEATFENSISIVIEKLLRHRKYLVKIIDEIHHLKFEKKVSYFVIYGIKDESIRLMV